MVKTYRLADKLSLIDVVPPIAGFERFLGVYVLEDEHIALVDVGPTVSIPGLIAGLEELKIRPQDVSYVLATHIHIDHLGGLGQALQYMPKARALVHEKGVPHMVDPARLWEDSQRALGEQARRYQAIESVAQDKMIAAREGMSLSLGQAEIEVLETPGHASHHLSFWDKKARRAFVGEAAGVYVDELDLVRPATPPPFNLEQGLTSIDKLINLNPEALCYGHFGMARGAADKLRFYRQQLILWGKIVADCLERGVAPQVMLERIRQQDRSLVHLNNLAPAQRDREVYFLNNSLMGFIGYFKRYGTDYLKRLLD